MRYALLVVVVGVALAGCSSQSDSRMSGTTPPAVPSTAPAVQGPTAARSVPAGAFVTPADLGPGWTTAAAIPTPCPTAVSHTAVGSVGLAEARGTLTETLATGADISAAVAAWRQSLSQCGYAVHDDALGDAAVTARSPDGADAVFVTGTDGVLVVLHAHGALARATDELAGWADLALGTSCVAAAVGCH